MWSSSAGAGKEGRAGTHGKHERVRGGDVHGREGLHQFLRSTNSISVHSEIRDKGRGGAETHLVASVEPHSRDADSGEEGCGAVVEPLDGTRVRGAAGGGRERGDHLWPCP